ncbi:GroES-like superfamily [Sesbania bispinosa]|nr:GroES-like superfamily [Sesbania bispinosa]
MSPALAIEHTAVAWEAGKPLVIEEVEIAATLTSTSGKLKIVESVGEGVTDLKPWDQVLPVFTGKCKECQHCKSEESNMCDLLRINTDRGVMLNDDQSRFSINGQPIYHFVRTSTFSEYTLVHVGCVAKINPAAPLDKGFHNVEGLGATLNVAKPSKGSSVAIFGLGSAAEGAIGLLVPPGLLELT